MNLIAFYLVHGQNFEDLLNMSYIKQTFLHCARHEYYEEEKLKWKAIISEILSEMSGGGK